MRAQHELGCGEQDVTGNVFRVGSGNGKRILVEQRRAKARYSRWRKDHDATMMHEIELSGISCSDFHALSLLSPPFFYSWEGAHDPGLTGLLRLQGADYELLIPSTETQGAIQWVNECDPCGC